MRQSRPSPILPESIKNHEMNHMSNQTLLVELFTEELPPKALAKLGEAFAAGIFNGLKARDFLDADAAATVFAR